MDNRPYLSYISILFCCLTLLISGCSTTGRQDGPPKYDVDVSQIHNAVPKPIQKSRYGNPPSYVVLGKQYHVLNSSKGYEETGIASWYGTKFNHQLTSDHEVYDMYKMTAAHKSLPLPTYVQVTNLETGKQIIVKVNDRGPFEKNRIIDLSYVAAKKLGILAKGTGLVKLVALNPGNSQSTTHIPTNLKPEIFVQVGAYSSKTNAVQVVLRVQNHTTIPCKIYAGKWDNKPIYRVQVGPVRDVDIADHLVASLSSSGLPTPSTIIKEVPKSQSA